jgi:hypothetical protein
MARHQQTPSPARPFFQLAQAWIGEEIILCTHQDRRLIYGGEMKNRPEVTVLVGSGDFSSRRYTIASVVRTFFLTRVFHLAATDVFPRTDFLAR